MRAHQESPSGDEERIVRNLLWRLRPRDLQKAVKRFEARVLERVVAGDDPQTAWETRFRRARSLVIARLLSARFHRGATSASFALNQRRSAMAALLEQSIPTAPVAGPDLHCDAALGGLSRWLRAWGYDAVWWPGIDDDELLRKALGSSAILLTTDTRLMTRGVITHGIIPALVIPISLKKFGQFRHVLDTLRLPRQNARCMPCGGSLLPVAKETFKDQIPPRTYPWLDEFYRCERCGQLFWPGTHWERIEARMAAGARE